MSEGITQSARNFQCPRPLGYFLFDQTREFTACAQLYGRSIKKRTAIAFAAWTTRTSCVTMDDHEQLKSEYPRTFIFAGFVAALVIVGLKSTRAIADDAAATPAPASQPAGKFIASHSGPWIATLPTFSPREHPAAGLTRLHYEMNAKTADMQRFRLEAYRPREFARFTDVSLDPTEATAPTAEGRKGDRLPKTIESR